jgi:hypothetical protein
LIDNETEESHPRRDDDHPGCREVVSQLSVASTRQTPGAAEIVDAA